MPRSRMIKPEFWDDEKLATISRDARLTFIALWTYSDDYGVVKGNATWLKSKVYPYEEIRLGEFQKWLTELEKVNCVASFSVDGEKYLFIRSFTKHQFINRPSSQRNPEPPLQLMEDSLSTHGGLNDERGRAETETETEVKQKQKAAFPPFEEIINLLNESCGKNFKAVKSSKEHIQARWQEGFRIEDFKKVIGNMKALWGNDQKMKQYLRPETLFGTKFQGYLNTEPLISVSTPDILGQQATQMLAEMKKEKSNG